MSHGNKIKIFYILIPYIFIDSWHKNISFTICQLAEDANQVCQSFTSVAKKIQKKVQKKIQVKLIEVCFFYALAIKMFDNLYYIRVLFLYTGCNKVRKR